MNGTNKRLLDSINVWLSAAQLPQWCVIGSERDGWHRVFCDKRPVTPELGSKELELFLRGAHGATGSGVNEGWANDRE